MRKSEAKQVFCFQHQTSTLLNLLKQSKQEKLLPCRLIHSMDLLAMRDIPRFAVVDGLPHGLLDSLLPGPVTVILKKGDSSILEKSLNPGLDSIGVRVPDYDFICAIARGFGSALALTSANLSGQLSSVSPKDFEHLWHHCAHIFDGGLLQGSRAGSTVVDLTKAGTYKILRTGSAREETVAVLRSFFLKEVL